MSTNQSPEFLAAQKRFLSSKSDEEKLSALDEMIQTMPKHKSAEAMRANLKTRYKKLKEKIENIKQSSRKTARKHAIKKSEMQAAIIGLANSGKSSILSCLTNAKPEIADYEFTSKEPILGTLKFEDIQIQLIDMPAINSEYSDMGIINTADTLVIVINKIKDLEEIFQFLTKSTGKQIIVFNKLDLLSNDEKRKIASTLQSKRYNFIMISAKTKENLNELARKIFLSFNKIRVYTKEPGKPPSKQPIILDENSSVEDAAEKIFHSLSQNIKETKITGPSSKFPNQKVSLSHNLKDKDIIEFHLK